MNPSDHKVARFSHREELRSAGFLPLFSPTTGCCFDEIYIEANIYAFLEDGGIQMIQWIETLTTRLRGSGTAITLKLCVE